MLILKFENTSTTKIKMSTSYGQIMDKFYEAAAAGDVESVIRGVKVMTDPNKRNEKGWTALMFAARNGHGNVVKAIMENGCV